MRFTLVLLVAGIVLFSGAAVGFEKDVHFGLTKWLALQAGFTGQQADALATGDQRVDSGDIQFLELVSAYSCVGKDAESAGEVLRHHYPSAGPVPGPIEKRVVIAGGDRPRQAALEVTKVTEKQAGYMLYKFGEVLHAVQDSWSHQGTPDLPRLLEGAITCDPAYAWGHPRSRGGWNSHNADLTHLWPADTIAMANATYDLLQKYPAIGGVQRSPKPWATLRAPLEGFVRASTKAQKKKWFAEQGAPEVSFLEGITLPDGAEAFDLQWHQHKLPNLPTLHSDQHRVDAGLRDFFSRFFIQWMSSDDFDAIAAEFGGTGPASPNNARGTPAAMDKAELASRLRAWRIRDHGRVADLAHSLQPLTAAQRTSLAAIAKNSQALVRYASPTEGFFPLLVKGPEPSPLLGFLIDAVPPAANGNERAVASTKFRHAPYDTVMVLAERTDGRWRIVSLGATVDH